jgi:hypothetical protein
MPELVRDGCRDAFVVEAWGAGANCAKGTEGLVSNTVEFVWTYDHEVASNRCALPLDGRLTGHQTCDRERRVRPAEGPLQPVAMGQGLSHVADWDRIVWPYLSLRFEYDPGLVILPPDAVGGARAIGPHGRKPKKLPKLPKAFGKRVRMSIGKEPMNLAQLTLEPLSPDPERGD